MEFLSVTLENINHFQISRIGLQSINGVAHIHEGVLQLCLLFIYLHFPNSVVHIASYVKMTWVINLKECGKKQSQGMYYNFSGGTVENTKHSKITGLPLNIQSWHLPNAEQVSPTNILYAFIISPKRQHVSPISYSFIWSSCCYSVKSTNIKFLFLQFSPASCYA
jgi:hypothetical protein